MWDDGDGYGGGHLMDGRLVVVSVRGNSIDQIVHFAPL